MAYLHILSKLGWALRARGHTPAPANESRAFFLRPLSSGLRKNHPAFPPLETAPPFKAAVQFLPSVAGAGVTHYTLRVAQGVWRGVAPAPRRGFAREKGRSRALFLRASPPANAATGRHWQRERREQDEGTEKTLTLFRRITAAAYDLRSMALLTIFCARFAQPVVFDSAFAIYEETHFDFFFLLILGINTTLSYLPLFGC